MQALTGSLAVQVQDAMMQGMWVDDVLALPNCGAELGDNAQVRSKPLH